jgi:lysophospholipase L1-like esterase
MMPTSIAIKGRDFRGYVDQGMSPGEFSHIILAEGDSWMERSSAFTASLPDYLARAMRDESVLIINLAMYGDTMRRMGEAADGEFGWWLKQFQFKAILLSAGGNDFIDAARDPDPGRGILRDMRALPMPTDASQCVDLHAVDLLVRQYLNPNFDQLFRMVRQSALNAATPIFLNEYDTPMARNAPAPPMKRAWLKNAYEKNGIHESMWVPITQIIFGRLQDVVRDWSLNEGVSRVPTQGTLTPAVPGSTGPSGDWINEIHPDASGWEKLASIWRQELLKKLRS